MLKIKITSYKNIKQDGSKLIINETIKPTGSDKDVTLKEAKKQFNAQGFTCK